MERNDQHPGVQAAPDGYCHQCGRFPLAVQPSAAGEVTVHDCLVGRLSARIEAGRVVWKFEAKPAAPGSRVAIDGMPEPEPGDGMS